jgi:hypothetical protein
MTKVINILKPVFVATKEAEGDNACIADVIPLLKKLYYEIDNVAHVGIGTFKASIQRQLKRYFDTKYGIESRKEYSIATLLDPRYKCAAFRAKENASMAKQQLIQEMVVINRSEPADGEDNVAEVIVEEEQPSNAWDAILNDGTESEGSQNEDIEVIEAPYRKQVNEYLKEKRVTDLKQDPLDYWAVNKDRYNFIAPVVRKYHSPPPGSTAAERLFSTAGNVLGKKRLGMKPENLESNLFLKYNLRALGLGYSNKSLANPPEDFQAPNRPELPTPTNAEHDAMFGDSEGSDCDIIISSDSDRDTDEEG